MSLPEQVEIGCPYCTHPQAFTFWKSINASLKEQLLKGEINLFKCVKCHEEARIPIDLLYHDMELRVIIYLIYPDDEGRVDVEFLSNPALKAPSRDYRLRIVTSRNQLIEKIFIFDDGFDDRVIELLKLAVWEQHARTEQAPEDRLFYQALTEDNELVFVMYDSSGHSTSLGLSRDGYLHAYAWMRDKLASHSEGEPSWLFVNRDFAVDMVSSQPGGSSPDAEG